MNIKNHLEQIGRLDKRIQNKLEEIDKLRRMASGTSYSESERVQTSLSADKIGAIASRIVDMEKEVDRLIDERCVIVAEIESMKNEDDYDILANIYILGKDIKTVAVEMGKSYRYISDLHRKALKDFEELYKSKITS